MVTTEVLAKVVWVLDVEPLAYKTPTFSQVLFGSCKIEVLDIDYREEAQIGVPVA